MIVDLNSVDAGTVFEADVCVVGAGAAGVALARRLAELGRSVCLLESGGFDFEADTQDQYAGANVGMPYYDLVDARLRFFGGTTNIWGGRCAALDAMDYRRRSWVPHSGWPIGANDLHPYLERVHAAMELGPVRYGHDVWAELGEQPPVSGRVARRATTLRVWAGEDGQSQPL